MSTVSSKSGQYRVFDVEGDGTTMQDVLDNSGLESYEKGAGYYQVGSKKESISAKKLIVLMPKDGAKKEAVDDQAEVRKILKLKGAGKINEDQSDEYNIFVQSTSTNRKLIEGAKMLYKVGGVGSSGGDEGEEDEDGEKKSKGKKRKAPAKKGKGKKGKKKGGDDEEEDGGGGEEEDEDGGSKKKGKKAAPAKKADKGKKKKKKGEDEEDEEGGDGGEEKEEGGGGGEGGEGGGEEEEGGMKKPLMKEFATRIRAMIKQEFPGCDKKITEFIARVSVHWYKLDNAFAKHLAGECKCTDATCVTDKGRSMKEEEWFGSDFFYEDNWHFGEGLLKGYNGCMRFPEYFPLEDMDEVEPDGDETFSVKQHYDIGKLCAELCKCVSETLKEANTKAAASGGK